jgi:predicted MFS family arabinose efflux permease
MTEQVSRSVMHDLRSMLLIGLGHSCSHFFQLVLPSLFPFLILEFGVSYTELGMLMTLFFVVSGLGQPVAGFLVDRFGARNLLIGGLAVYCLGILLAALAPHFWLLVPAMMLAAIGNCVFHPADFTVLNASVSSHRLGRAFSVHTLGGNLGWAAAPVTMLTVESFYGWRAALLVACAIGLVVLLGLVLARRDLREERAATAGPEQRPAGVGAGVLFSAPVLLCFSYFVLLAAALIAVQNFLGPMLEALRQTPLAIAATALTGFLLGASAGVLMGGFVADRWRHHGLVIAAGLASSGTMFLLVSELALPSVILILVISAAGLLQGVTTPSRDLLVRSATPVGATGRVFGFVYSGLDLGSALAPATVGILLDGGHPRWVFWLIAAMLFAAIGTAVSINREARPRPQPAE